MCELSIYNASPINDRASRPIMELVERCRKGKTKIDEYSTGSFVDTRQQSDHAYAVLDLLTPYITSTDASTTLNAI